MKKTLHRQHADLQNAVIEAAEAFLNRIETDAAPDELAEAVTLDPD